MNHFVLPHGTADQQSPRFGDVAIKQLLGGMLRLGCRVASLRAKIFGGATVLPFGAASETVGQQNVQLAVERFRHHGIALLARNTGGRTGMLIRLYTESGDVLVRKLAEARQVHICQMSEPDCVFCD